MKKIPYFILAFGLLAIVGFRFGGVGNTAFAADPVKPANLDCSVPANATNEWCDIEKPNPVYAPESYPNNDTGIPDTGSCSITSSTDLFTKVPVYKAKGDDVKKLQSILNNAQLSVAPLKVDGSFGPKTQNAIKDFQKIKGFAVTGKIGPKTIQALLNVYCSTMDSVETLTD